MNRNKTRQKISSDVIAHVRQIDLLTYLRTNEPDNLVRVTPNMYCTREHDSLKISNGKWFWWSRGFGGHSALDYLVEVKEYSFVEAVEILAGERFADWTPPSTTKKTKTKNFILPKRNANANRVFNYLFGRGIAPQLIQDCITKGILFESADYHNAVFVGRDSNGTPKYAALRGTRSSSFKGDASGSDKRYSFRLPAEQRSESVHVFEAAIDLLSYATYLDCEGQDYKTKHLLSLSGVYQPAKNISESKIPVALAAFLTEHPEIESIILHLDNDKAGRLAAETIMELLKRDYLVIDAPPPSGKDVNDFLQSYLQKRNQREG